MLPVACLPIGGILMGIGYWIDPAGWGANSMLALLLIKAGGILIDNMAILFALGVAIGMSKDQEGTSALAAIISWLTVQTMLGTAVVQLIIGADATVNPAFGKINNQFIGILCGLIAAWCYNKFHKINMPDFLGFFAGRRFVPIMTVVVTLLICIPLYFVWPVVYTFLVSVGEGILGMGAIGAGIYGFLNRLLIPVGLHHALNSVFWFDVANISDIGKFWGSVEGGVLGQTGMYQAGFFPVMMFGLPGAALAMYHTAKPEKKKIAGGILLSAALCSFFTGVTEPLEFMFMFCAMPLYVVYAILQGCAFAMAGIIHLRLHSFGNLEFITRIPMSLQAGLGGDIINFVICVIVFFAIGYFVAYFMIGKFKLATPGRLGNYTDDNADENTAENTGASAGNGNSQAERIIALLGGRENIVLVDACMTRLRVTVKDPTKVADLPAWKAEGALSLLIKGDGIQAVYGPKADVLKSDINDIL